MTKVKFDRPIDLHNRALEMEREDLLRLVWELACDVKELRDGLPERRVYGWCPMGCGETLFLAAQGVVECVKVDCPDSLAVTALLADREMEHVVTFQGDGWQAKHPIRERIADELLSCPIGDAVKIMIQHGVDGLPEDLVHHGIYRVYRSPIGPGGWAWEDLAKVAEEKAYGVVQRAPEPDAGGADAGV